MPLVHYYLSHGAGQMFFLDEKKKTEQFFKNA